MAEDHKPTEEDRPADRLALQVWVIMFLVTLCVAFLKFILGK